MDGREISEPKGDELSAFGAAFVDGGAIVQLDEGSVPKTWYETGTDSENQYYAD